MKKAKLFEYLLIGFVAALIIPVLYHFSVATIVQYWGRRVVVTVTEVSTICTRRGSQIVVALGNTIHNVDISQSECRNQVYKVGQQVTVLKHDKFGLLLMPDERPDAFLICLFVVFLLAYISNRDEIRKYYKGKRTKDGK
jgi:hypothetical protein